MTVSRDPLRPHSHQPNPQPPSDDPAFHLAGPDGDITLIGPADLMTLDAFTVPNCYIVSTGHGTSGPFSFTGARLVDLVRANVRQPWSQLEVISADGFGNRIHREELTGPGEARPVLLAYAQGGRPLTRADGLVRLIVPLETDDALRQVKWIGRINVLP